MVSLCVMVKLKELKLIRCGNMLTQEEKIMICKVLRRETACGMMDASHAWEELIKALKRKPKHIMDAPQNIKITWEYNKE